MLIIDRVTLRAIFFEITHHVNFGSLAIGTLGNFGSRCRVLRHEESHIANTETTRSIAIYSLNTRNTPPRRPELCKETIFFVFPMKANRTKHRYCSFANLIKNISEASSYMNFSQQQLLILLFLDIQQVFIIAKLVWKVAVITNFLQNIGNRSIQSWSDFFFSFEVFLSFEWMH